MKNMVQTIGTKAAVCMKLAAENIKRNYIIAISAGLCIIGLGLVVLGATTFLGNRLTDTKEPPPVISWLSVSNVSDRSAVISWKTDKPYTSSVQVYSQDNVLINTVNEKTSTMEHRVVVDNL